MTASTKSMPLEPGPLDGTKPTAPTKTDAAATKRESQFSTIFNSFNLSKEIVVECKGSDKEDRTASGKEAGVDRTKPDAEKYSPPNNIGSITITPVPSVAKNDSRQQNSDKRKPESTIRVKTQATLIKEAEELARKEKDRHRTKQRDGDRTKPHEKRIDTPLHVDTTQPKDQKKSDGPNPTRTETKEEISQRQIETMRVAENNIPRPALIPVHHSPTFAKPDRRPPETKKPKKDVVIVSDMDPLEDVVQEPLSIDDSSSDVEVVEDLTGKSEPIKPNELPIPKKSDSKSNSDVKKQSDSRQSDTVVQSNREKTNSNLVVNHKKESSHSLPASKHSSKDRTKTQERIHISSKDHKSVDGQKRYNHQMEKLDADDTHADINKVMQNLREMQVSSIRFKI